jgi:hypothetical protein
MPFDWRRPVLGFWLCACTGQVSEGERAPMAPGDPTDTPPVVPAPSGGSSSMTPGGGGAGNPVGGAASPGSESGGTSGISAGSPSSGGATQPAVSACATAPVDPGPAPLRLLTRAQYLNTLTELFGRPPELDAVLTGRAHTLAIGAGQGDVSQIELEDYQRAAETLATRAVAGDALDELAPCAKDAKARDCARSFVVDFGARAYRAPLTEAADIEGHLALFDDGASTDYRHGIELLVRGMLQSARFLYRVELGTGEKRGDSAVALSGHELATRLAYTFWDGPPDASLTKAATDGELSSAAGIADAAARVLDAPRGKDAVRRFLEALIQLGALDTSVKDREMFPEWESGALRASLAAQARHFFHYVLGEQDGKVSILLGTPRVFADRELGAYYGKAAGDDFQGFDLSADQAAGLLTLPALLAINAKPSESSPIYRGKFVREMLLCQVPPAPPPDIPAAPEVEPGVSTRERLRQHEVDKACSGCHALLDPIGFGFEHYDAIGRFRDSDGGKPVDAKGEIVGTQALNGSFDGVRELADRLATSGEVRDCLARQYFRFVLARYEGSADACSVERVLTSFRDSDANLNTLPAAVVATDAFAYRRPIVPGKGH